MSKGRYHFFSPDEATGTAAFTGQPRNCGLTILFTPAERHRLHKKARATGFRSANQYLRSLIVASDKEMARLEPRVKVVVPR